MSRRDLDRTLPDFSQLLDRATELPLSEIDQQGGIDEGEPGVVTVLGCNEQLQLRPGLGWVRLGHPVHRVTAAPPVSSRIGDEDPHEGGGAC